MSWRSIKTDFNTVLLLMFLGAWLYTEITEDIERDDFQDTLIQRIERIEAYIEKQER